ncbi:MAG: YceI family protein [Candidatus Marinimicrobia bacterium]|nr:YceI family protein [Candidatus Neomarinimicrobiota bacterium]MBT4360638.1 YceI family protein [Candidatus Neomarinimicrobiota bacterium]MBT4715944.1 YceI family protein [Candidatus Neomarinimicrobiota bacterium]MBT4948123.1 YceI family protein [Candidatus Neomarinimicrobiota bacterium]MBT5271005.1 YceI family protein [Candidatus Neomarinimicrobiota bacterium]
MKLNNLIAMTITILPLLSWANITITEANGSFEGLGHARTHDFPVEARIFTVSVSDADTSGNRTVNVEVSVNDLHTGNAMRDTHMRMSVLDRKKHPLITFKSDVNLPELKDGAVSLAGNLQVNGITKPFTLMLDLKQSAGKWNATGSFLIVPTDFDLPLVGMGPMKVLDKVNLNLDVSF